MQYYINYKSPLGNIIIASDREYITGIWFEGQKYFEKDVLKGLEKKSLPILKEVEKWLDIYFSGIIPNFLPPLFLEGISPFRKRVWEIMLEIPYGKTITYGEIAKRIEKERGRVVSAQAVGGAVGHNKFAIVIPCHRVMGKNGEITGYAGGLAKKIELLKLEGHDLNKFQYNKY